MTSRSRRCDALFLGLFLGLVVVAPVTSLLGRNGRCGTDACPRRRADRRTFGRCLGRLAADRARPALLLFLVVLLLGLVPASLVGHSRLPSSLVGSACP